MLELVKTALRVSSDLFDENEILPIIEACKTDLKLSGVNNIDEDDAIIVRAAILYAKANFGYFDDAERYALAYEALKRSLSLSGDYGGARL